MRKILITGASTGLGMEMSKYLSKNFYVIAVSRRFNLMKKNFKSFNNIEFHQLDLSKKKKLIIFLKLINKKHPDIDYVINNAAIFQKEKFNNIKQADLEYNINLNLFAPVIIMNFFIKSMRKKNFGRIINISSGAAYNCFEDYSMYSATKASLNVFSLTAAKEYKNYNIKINLFSPGPIKTKMTGSNGVFPISRVLPTIDFLLKEDKNLFTGQFVWIDRILPQRPDLKGVQWFKGKASNKFPLINKYFNE